MAQLQRLRPDHASAVLAFELANRAFFAAAISDRGDEYFEHFTEQHDERVAEQEAGSGAFYLLVDGDSSVLGRFNLIFGPDDSAVLGYRVAQHVCGQGVATASVRELCQLAATRHGVRMLRAATAHSNVASQRVLIKAGFVPVGPAEPADLGGKAGTWYQRDLTAESTPDGLDAVAGTDELDLNPLSSATNHNGGSLHFGPGGMLYVGGGENANGANAQTLSNRLGKMLRTNPDGSIPSGNPFYHRASGANRAIWALGLRNPFTFAFQPGTGRMFIDDVGQSAHEEIDVGQAGANYGWDLCEGRSGCPAGTKLPYFTYPHSGPQPSGCAITGGTFYNPTTRSFPKRYLGDYFFSDLGSGWIYRIETTGTRTVHRFATDLGSPVDLDVGPHGGLLYLSHNGTVGRMGAPGASGADHPGARRALRADLSVALGPVRCVSAEVFPGRAVSPAR